MGMLEKIDVLGPLMLPDGVYRIKLPDNIKDSRLSKFIKADIVLPPEVAQKIGMGSLALLTLVNIKLSIIILSVILLILNSGQRWLLAIFLPLVFICSLVISLGAGLGTLGQMRGIFVAEGAFFKILRRLAIIIKCPGGIRRFMLLVHLCMFSGVIVIIPSILILRAYLPAVLVVGLGGIIEIVWALPLIVLTVFFMPLPHKDNEESLKSKPKLIGLDKAMILDV